MKKQKENENPIHVRIDYDEALESKEQLLSSKINLIEMIKIIEKYKSIRAEELRLKRKLKRATGPCLSQLKKINKAIPKIKVKEPSKKDDEKIQFEKIKKHIKEENKLEEELKKIREKLKELQRE